MPKQRGNTEFLCSYCGQTFIQETRFLSHNCKEMKREKRSKSVRGKAAFELYRVWFRARKRVPPSFETFYYSRYFNTFYKFVGFLRQRNIPDTVEYVKLMARKELLPQHWMSDEVYGLYLMHLDAKASPLKLAKITVDTIFKIADEAKCKPGDIFEHLLPTEVIQLVRVRRLSPWILFTSKKFQQFYSSMDTEPRSVLDGLIDPQKWIVRFKQNPSVKATMKEIVKEIGL